MGKEKKIIRSILQGIVLLALLIVLIRALFVFKKYDPYDSQDTTVLTGEDNGFIAISYIAADREGSSTIISTKRLDEHIKAIKDNGYITIGQEDIMNYYKNGIPLPKKSLYIMFEDGRTDTAIFAGKIMEKHNYIGTMLSYAEKFDNKDAKFLSPKDLKKLQKSTFWEMGTNGYRLSYINVFDRYDNHLGELTDLEYNELTKFLERDYNQYLMDYIRDKDGIPKESYENMRTRISEDYELMEQIYKDSIGNLPQTYVLMHANTGAFGNNDKVSDVNEEWIKKLFAINFNREGYSFNTRDSSIYDLTRMQPQPYWYPNHLLMRIADDTGKEVIFNDGDINKKEKWEVISGAPEFRGSIIALTSQPRMSGLMRLKDSKEYGDIHLSTTLIGNKLGTQGIYLRADEDLKDYILVKVQNNNLIITKNNEMIYELSLDLFDGVKYQTIAENQQETLEAEYELYKRGNKKFASPTNMQEQTYPVMKDVTGGHEEEYIPSIQINELGNRKLDIYLTGDKLSINIDGKNAIQDLVIGKETKGYVYLESAWGEYGYSQRNIADDVYDGVFENLLITEHKTEAVLYDNRLQGFDKISAGIKDIWNNLINWFVSNL